VIVVSPILKRVVYPWLANSGYLRRRADGGVFCVLTYHGVLPAGYEVDDPQRDGSLVSAENLRGQLQLLKECYYVVSPDEVRDWTGGGKELPERAVLLTCDDGLRKVLTDMTPILREEGVSCLFFVLGASAAENAQMLWYEELYLLLMAVWLNSRRISPGFIATSALACRPQRPSTLVFLFRAPQGPFNPRITRRSTRVRGRRGSRGLA
jgi:hypothetical protein